MADMQKKSEPENGIVREIRKLGVVLEHVDSKVDQLAEGQQGLQEQIKIVDGKVEDLRGEMDYKFEVVFEEFEKIHVELKQKVDRSEFEARVGPLERQASR